MGQILRMASIGATTLAIGLTLGCSNMAFSAGDGQVRDRGPFAATDRFVVELGTIDLREAGPYHYELRNLPQAELTLGFSISFKEAQETIALIHRRPIVALVEVELLRSDGERIIYERGSLGALTWSASGTTTRSAFIYGESHGGTHGTTFAAQPDQQYTLSIRVLEPDTSAAEYQAMIEAKGGGWK